MAQVIFYEKPGCINNAKQKKWLIAAGHDVISKNILEAEWSPDELLPYFGDRPVTEWFNKTAPRVKSGEIVPESFGVEDALALMVKDPILIRRPLLRVDDKRMQGFDKNAIHAWIGLQPSEGNEAVVEKLQKDDLTIRPRPDKNARCDDQAPAIPEKPLSLMMEITNAAGLEVTYAYDDLVFVSHNIFIYRFTEIGRNVDIFFNKDCEAQAEQRFMETLLRAAKDKGITLSRRGHYTLSEAEEENISIEFLEAP
ncbi:nitrogenase-associated protein [delta proteobacterium NaphS2]|nr:nitrogenase-associated protein [delta proteobacterium NaphS2]